MHRHSLRKAAGPMGAGVLCLCFLFAAGMPAQGPATGGIGELRRPAFTAFEAPGAATGDGQGTEPASLNAEGTIAGFYGDANNVLHSFVRAIDGTITTFDAPGAGTSSGQGTDACCINGAGMVAGSYVDASGINHGFVRAADATSNFAQVPRA